MASNHSVTARPQPVQDFEYAIRSMLSQLGANREIMRRCRERDGRVIDTPHGRQCICHSCHPGVIA